MIPNNPPPKLPDPEKFTADFNDFVRVCLQKDPNKRPDAATLLKTVRAPVRWWLWNFWDARVPCALVGCPCAMVVV